MIFNLFVLIAIFAFVASADVMYDQAHLTSQVFGDVTILHNVPKASNDPMGFSNVLFQGVTYDKQCSSGSAYLWQAYEGGLCMKVNNGGAIQSQRAGCSPPAESSTAWTVNVLQFSSQDCTGTPVQAVEQFKSTTDCVAVDDATQVYSSFYRMTCKDPSANTDNVNEFHGLLTAFHPANDPTCTAPTMVGQGIIAGACIKGTKVDAAGNQVATNTSSVMSCKDASDMTINVFQGNVCSGPSQAVPMKVPDVTCTAGQWGSGEQVYEVQKCQ